MSFIHTYSDAVSVLVWGLQGLEGFLDGSGRSGVWDRETGKNLRCSGVFALRGSDV